MSEENLKVVRRYFGLAPEDPEEFSDGAADFWEPNGDYYPVRGFPEAVPCHGREEIVDFLKAFRVAWAEYSYEVMDAKEIGDDRVFVHGRARAKGRTSGAPQEGDVYHACWLRHGRFVRLEDHLTKRCAPRAWNWRRHRRAVEVELRQPLWTKRPASELAL
jgi:hypothetical protein